MQKLVSLFFCVAFAFLSCSTGKKIGQNEISITNWNVQTFFDGNNDGIEYSEFRKPDAWNAEFYEQRLIKLCSMIEKFDSDIIVMEEIENEKIIYDISNRLSNNEWFKNKKYLYATFGKKEGASIGCAVLSRYRIEDVSYHDLDVRTEKGKVPELRPVMEVTIDVDRRGEFERGRFKIFVNHWKSKAGGAKESEKWRFWQETVLAGLFRSRGVLCVAAGDFNKDIGEFARGEDHTLYFTELDEGHNQKIKVYSPWDEYENTENGSYYFKGRWERIDHFFCNEKEAIVKFTVEDRPEIINEDGSPAGYKIFNKSGYSDHLPITCKIKLSPDL